MALQRTHSLQAQPEPEAVLSYPVANATAEVEPVYILPEQMDADLKAEADAAHAAAVRRAKFYGEAAPAPKREKTEAEIAYLKKLNPAPVSVFDAAAARLTERYTTARTWPVAPISFEEGRVLLATIISGELAKRGRTACYTDHDKQVIRDLLKYFLNDPTGPLDLNRGIYLYGGVGVGKSFLMESIRTLCNLVPLDSNRFEIDSTKFIVAEVAMSKSLAVIKPMFGGNRLFDDLGDEPAGAKAYGDEYDVIDTLLSKRYMLFIRDGIRTHFTSNFPFDQLENIYGTRMKDRFDEWLQPVELKGSSKRPAADQPINEEGQ